MSFIYIIQKVVFKTWDHGPGSCCHHRVAWEDEARLAADARQGAHAADADAHGAWTFR